MSGALEVEVMPATVDEFADRIRAHQADAVGSLVAIGREFVSAQTVLGHGAVKLVAGKVGMTERNVNRYMAIAKNEALLDPEVGHACPTSLSALEHLARVPAEQLRRVVAAGTVTPELTGDNARLLVDGLLDRARPAPVEEPKPVKAPPSVDEVEARAAIDKACRYGNQYVREVAKTARALANADGELPAAKQLLAMAQNLAAHAENQRFSQHARNHATQLLTDLAQKRLTRDEAYEAWRVTLDAELNNPDAPGSFEHAARLQDSETPSAAATGEGTSPAARTGDVPVDQGPSSPSAPRPGDGVEAASTAAQSDDEPATSSSPSPLEGADVEPVVGDDDASESVEGSAAPVSAGPPTAPSLEARWTALTETQRVALELVVTENAQGRTVRYSNVTAAGGELVGASLYHQTADALAEWDLVEVEARTSIEATELGIELVLTFGKVAAGGGHGSASGTSPAACTECGDVEGMRPHGRAVVVRDGLCEVCAGNLADIEAGSSEDTTPEGAGDDETLPTRAPGLQDPSSSSAPRGEVTEEEPEPGGYSGARGFVPGVHDQHGGGGSKPDLLYQQGDRIVTGLLEALSISVPGGAGVEQAIARFIARQGADDRAEARRMLQGWRDCLGAALFLTEEVKAGG